MPVYHSGTPLTPFAPSRRSSTRGAYFLDLLCAVWEQCSGHCIQLPVHSALNGSVKIIRLDILFNGTAREFWEIMTSLLYFSTRCSTSRPSNFSLFYEHRKRLGGSLFGFGSSPPRFRLPRLGYGTCYTSSLRHPGTSVLSRNR